MSDEKIVVQAGGNKLLMLALVVSISINAVMGLRYSELSQTLAETETSSQIIHNSYVGLFQWISNKHELINREARSGGFFSRLFGPSAPIEGFEDELNQWKDPYNVPEIEG